MRKLYLNPIIYSILWPLYYHSPFSKPHQSLLHNPPHLLPCLSLNDQFARKGIKFLETTDTSTNTFTPIVELSIRNGSSLRLQILNAHVTSYKPKYWKDDGFEEVLYTLPQSKGGVGLVLNDVTQPPPPAAAATAKKADPFKRSDSGSGSAPKGSILAGVVCDRC